MNREMILRESSRTTPTATTTASKPGRKPRGTAGSASAGIGSANSRKSNPSLSGLADRTDAETNQRAATILEVLAGLRTPGQAAEALKISVNYYYVLERKALQGLVSACRPQPKGPVGKAPQRQLEELRLQLDRCQNECQRQAALLRATQRAVGLPAATEPKAKGKAGAAGAKKRRRHRPSVRALRAVEVLRKNSALEKSTIGVEQEQLRPPPVESSTTTQSMEDSHGAMRQETSS